MAVFWSAEDMTSIAILVSWNLSAGRASLINQGDGTASFDSTLPSSSCQFSPALTTNFYVPQFTPVCFTEAFNTSAYALNNLRINHGLTAQLNLQFDGEMAKRYHIGSHPATFEFGGKFRNAHKFDNAYSVEMDANSGVSIPVSQFPNSLTNNNYYGGAYKLGPNPAFQDVLNFANANSSEFTTTSSQGVDPSSYDLVEKVSSGYVMNTVDLTSKLRLVGGVRFEGTSLSTISFDQGDASATPHTPFPLIQSQWVLPFDPAQCSDSVCDYPEHQLPPFLLPRSFTA